MQFLIWLNPDSVQIDPCKSASSVTINYSIGIQHGHNFKHKIIPQEFCTQTGPDQVVDYALHHEATASFTRMHTTTDNDPFPLSDLLKFTAESSYD